MCGIVGYVGKRPVQDLLLAGLTRLEYRGYDSAGISVIAGASQSLEGRGRVLVRPSGTEQLVRVMVEAPDEDEADAVCDRLVSIVEACAAPA